MKIAIDGPAGAGKSTIARRTAKALSMIYVDTGAMYRAMAIHMIRKGVNASDTEAVIRACADADISIAFVEGEQQVLLNGENVTPLLRKEEVGVMASAVSACPEVREKLVELQRKLAAGTSVVMDGRDIGTVVLPDAELKIYLTASPYERAKRRAKELSGGGDPPADMLRSIQAEIEERDYRDMHREHSPLKQAEDAYLLDSSAMSIEDVTGRILELVGERNLLP